MLRETKTPDGRKKKKKKKLFKLFLLATVAYYGSRFLGLRPLETYHLYFYAGIKSGQRVSITLLPYISLDVALHSLDARRTHLLHMKFIHHGIFQMTVSYQQTSYVNSSLDVNRLQVCLCDCNFTPFSDRAIYPPTIADILG